MHKYIDKVHNMKTNRMYDEREHYVRERNFMIRDVF